MSSDRFSGMALLGIVLATSVVAWGSELPSVDEALGHAFPEAEIERESLFLTPDQLQIIGREAGVEGQRALATRFTLRRGGQVVGWAYMDTHRVRTLPETLIVMINPDGRIRRVEVVAFREPHDYLPPERWYEQFQGRVLGPQLELKSDIRSMTGATLSARAATDAVRRVLALHAAVTEVGG